MRDKISLKTPIQRRNSAASVSQLIQLGNLIIKCETKEELFDIFKIKWKEDEELPPRLYQVTRMIRNRIDFNDFDQVREIKTLKERLIVNVIGAEINQVYRRNTAKRGPKGDNIERFFDAITQVPQNHDDILMEHTILLSYDVIRQHRRYDPYGKNAPKEEQRGITKIKNGMIFRQPIKDNENGS